VFRVIYVAGSPIPYAAILPTISPGFTRLNSNFDLISPRIQSKDYEFNLSFNNTFFEFKIDLMYIFNSNVESSFASIISLQLFLLSRPGMEQISFSKF
jgi:hypothetical protein